MCSNWKQNIGETNHKTFAAPTSYVVGAVARRRDVRLVAAGGPRGPVVPNAVAGPLVARLRLDGAFLNFAFGQRRQNSARTRVVRVQAARRMNIVVFIAVFVQVL